MTNRERLLKEIERFREEHALSERGFSLAATGNPKFISRLKAGNITLRLFEAAEAFIKEQKARCKGQDSCGVLVGCILHCSNNDYVERDV